MACACAVTVPAFAHAFLDHAQPPVGGAVHSPPREVRLWFTERLERAFSRARVVDSAGRDVSEGESRIDPNDDTLMIVSLHPLTAGTYRVVWRVVSVDTHVTEGDFTFDVGP